ncbi:unnamed protein product [Aureobasidium mustum]|uniref:C3H1-type domain-containing protein n=1 Tax=Aureobasidium mustum TaxID=2773714 RepID=A0A9N8JRN8_9PEZI|nr:unnamed protein product [Aureobasidium mustum]
MRTILLMGIDSKMDPSHVMRQRNNRPICRMWQMGRCHLSSIQCEFRHADPAMVAQPMLAEGFVPQPRSSDARWEYGNHVVHRDRQPLQEIVLPASSTSVHEYEQDHQSAQEEAGQSTWGSPRSSPQRWSNTNPARETQAGTSDKLAVLTCSSWTIETAC